MEKMIQMIKMKQKLLIAVIVFIVVCLGITAIYYLYPSHHNMLTVKKDAIEVELGDKMSDDILFYLDTTQLTKKEKNSIKKDGQIKLPDEKEYLKKTGKYQVKISYQNDSVKKTVLVLDTTPPLFASSDNLTVPLNTAFSEEDAKKAFKVSDQDEYTLEVDLGGYNGSVEGTYTIKATAIDKSGNKTEYSFTITVSKDVTQIITSENTTQAVSTISKEVANKSEHVNNTTVSNTPVKETETATPPSGNQSAGNVVTGISITGNKEVYLNDTIFLTASINPGNIENVTYTWSANNDNAVVEGQGFPTVGIRGNKAGTTVITCQVQNVKATYTVTVKEKPAASAADFNAIKIHMVNPSKQYTHKTVKQMGVTQSGNQYTCTIYLGGNNGLVFNDNIGEKTAAGIYFEVDFDAWYCTTGFPQSYAQYLKNSLTYVFKDYYGNVLTVKLVVGDVNTDLESAWKIFNFA